jgi:glycosyltransferase involved in cell wall biosynthesis
MSDIRVVRVSNSAVVAEYRKRELVLRRRYGYDVHVVSPPAFHEGGSLVVASIDQEIPHHVVKTRGSVRNPNLFRYSSGELQRLLREIRPQIVDLHAEPYSLAAASALSAVKRAIPGARICMFSAQNISKVYPPPFRQLERRALGLADAAYPCSNGVADVLRRKGFTGEIHVLPLGVSAGRELSRNFSLLGLRVGFVGRLEPVKGADLAVRAFAQASEGLDASLDVVGSGSQRAHLEELTRRLNIVDRVAFQGPVPQEEALALISTYDVLLVPSIATRRWKEQFGRVVAQALAAGTPVIASRSGSLPEILGDCGELVHEGDWEDLARSLRQLLLEPARRAALSTRGHRRAVDCFSWEAVAAGCDRMYRQMLAQPGLRSRDQSRAAAP